MNRRDRRDSKDSRGTLLLYGAMPSRMASFTGPACSGPNSDPPLITPMSALLTYAYLLDTWFKSREPDSVPSVREGPTSIY